MLVRLFLLLAVFSPTLCRGNDLFPGIEFEKSFFGVGDIRDVKVWADGTVTLLGYGGSRITTIDPFGNVVANLTNSIGHAAAVAPDRTLFTADSWNFGSGPALEIKKLHPDGRMAWSTNIAGLRVYDILAVDDGGVLVLYTPAIYVSGESSLRLARLSSAGELLWNRPLTSQLGHSNAGASIHSVGNDGYVIGTSSQQGASEYKSEANFGESDLWIIRLNQQGEKVWDKTIGGSRADFFFGLTVLEDGFRIGASSFSGNDGNKTTQSRGGSDVWLVELDSGGNLRKQNVFGGPGDETFLSFVPLTEGYALLARSTSPPDGANKTAPAESPSGAPRSEWLLLLDDDFNIRADESYEKNVSSGVAILVANEDESLLWAAGATVRRLSLRYSPSLAFDTDDQDVFVGKPFTLKLPGDQRVPGTTFQWAFDGTAIPGATNQSYSIGQMGEDDAGAYQVTVWTPFGSVTSKAINLAVAYAESRLELVPSLVVRGILGMRYRIEASTPIAPTVWATIDSLTLTNIPQRWIDLNASPSQRFYRVRPE